MQKLNIDKIIKQYIILNRLTGDIMYKKEIERLKNQINKSEEIYLKNKSKREELVNTMTKLDKEIESLDKTINNKKKDEFEQTKNEIKKKNKFNLKYLMYRCIEQTLSQSIIFIIIDLFIGIQNLFPQMLFLLGINILGNTISYFKIREKVPKNRKLNKKEFENIQKRYQEIIEIRLNLGMQYKKVWDTEVKSQNIHKISKQLLTERINYINCLEISCSNDKKNIYMNDIYHKISLYWLEYYTDNETKKQILDNQLKEYLKEKISEINYSLFHSGKLDKLSSEELLTVLSYYIPKNQHNMTISHIIYAILGYASNMQSHSIVWLEEKDNSLKENPIITFDEYGRWNELITHKDTDYITIFNKVYETFFNNFMIKEKTKTKNN